MSPGYVIVCDGCGTVAPACTVQTEHPRFARGHAADYGWWTRPAPGKQPDRTEDLCPACAAKYRQAGKT